MSDARSACQLETLAKSTRQTPTLAPNNSITHTLIRNAARSSTKMTATYQEYGDRVFCGGQLQSRSRPVPNPPRETFNADRILKGKDGKGSLWQGAASTVHVADRYGFDVVILCAQEFQPVLPRSIEVIRFLSDDCPLTRAHLQEAIFISGKVERRVRAGKHVLCTCFAGLNRSALVIALATMKLTRKPGYEVVEHIQRRREGALCNESFARVLRKLRVT